VPSRRAQAWLYARLAEDWGPFLPPAAAASLARAGYFAVRRPPLVQGGKSLKILSVQTNYWSAIPRAYSFRLSHLFLCSNTLGFFLYLNDTDPGNQLHWLIDELQVT
jgi:hypothetical protein